MFQCAHEHQHRFVRIAAIQRSPGVLARGQQVMAHAAMPSLRMPQHNGYAGAEQRADAQPVGSKAEFPGPQEDYALGGMRIHHVRVSGRWST
jgi:hypothetical protein